MGRFPGRRSLSPPLEKVESSQIQESNCHARIKTHLRELQCPASTQLHRRNDLLVRMYLLPLMCRNNPAQCLPELRRRFLSPTHPTDPRLERRRLSRRISREHYDQTPSGESDRPPAVRGIHPIPRAGTALT